MLGSPKGRRDDLAVTFERKTYPPTLTEQWRRSMRRLGGSGGGHYADKVR